MYQARNLKERMTLFISIFLPILIYQLANFSASFVDTTMTGQYHTLHLAGVSMATSLWSPFFTFLTGIVSALVPIIGHHLGQKQEEKIASDFYQFIYLSLGLSLLLFGLVFFRCTACFVQYWLRTTSSRSCYTLPLVFSVWYYPFAFI